MMAISVDMCGKTTSNNNIATPGSFMPTIPDGPDINILLWFSCQGRDCGYA
jgi:hypothetical protein